MKYRFEYDKVDPDAATLHLDIDLMKFIPKREKMWKPDDEDEFFYGDDEAPVFLNRLLMMRGIESAVYRRYSIKLVKGSIFLWRDLTKDIIADLQVSLNMGKRAKEVYRSGLIKPPKRSLKKQRCQ